MKTFLVFFLTLMCHSIILGCMCLKDRDGVFKWYERYDYIARGRHIGENDSSYIFLIIEKFKGDVPDTLFHTKFASSCGIYTGAFYHFKGFDWRIYYQSDEIIRNNIVELHQCSPTDFLFHHPDSLSYDKETNEMFYGGFGFPLLREIRDSIKLEALLVVQAEQREIRRQRRPYWALGFLVFTALIIYFTRILKKSSNE